MISKQGNLIKRDFVFLIFSMIATMAVILVSNYVGQDAAILTGNLAYFPVTIAFVVLSVALAIRYRKTASSKFLICFSLSAIFWFIAEMTWTILELVYNESPFPSLADFFYVIGYVPMTVSFLLLVKPNLKSISFDTKILSTTVSSVVLIPLILLTSNQQQEDFVPMVISFIYPILDSVLLWFAITCIKSFAQRKNEFLVFASAAIFCFIFGDTWFTVSEINGTYYVGHPLDIVLLWSYILFAYSMIILNKTPDLLTAVLQGILDARQLKLKPKYKTPLYFATVSILFLIVLFSLNYFKFAHLSTNEESLLEPVLYAGLALITGLGIVEGVLQRKRSKTSQKHTMLLQELPAESDQILLIKRQLDRIESRSKQNTRITIMLVGVVLIISLSYVMINIIEMPIGTHLTSGRYLIENLKGDKIDTWVSWRIPKDEVLHVSLVNADVISQEKIGTIIEAISSKETLVLPNAFMNKDPPNLSSTYYDGWSGALQSIKDDAKFPIPTNFEVLSSGETLGEIVIILSTQKDTEGTLGFTRSITDEENNEILKSYITIFDVKNLNSEELSGIVRHEFGHALGLGHSTDESDLMSPKITSHQAFISECDLDAIISLYKGEKITEVVCRH